MISTDSGTGSGAVCVRISVMCEKGLRMRWGGAGGLKFRVYGRVWDTRYGVEVLGEYIRVGRCGLG